MNAGQETARERALRRAAEAAGSTYSPPEARVRAALATPVENQAASRGGVVKLDGDKLRYVVARVKWLGTGWAYDILPIRSGRLGAPTYTTTLPRTPLRPLGAWDGRVEEGAVGAVIPSDKAGTTPPNTTPGEARAEQEGQMATITRKGGAKKSGAKSSTKTAAAKKATGSKAKAPAAASNRRTTEDIDKLVPAIVKSLQGGAKMNDVKAEFGFSHGQPIRQALARNGYDSKGNALAVEEITGKGKALAQKVAARRADGEAWYILAKATGQSEGELRALLTEHGFSAEGRTYRAPAPKPAPTKKAPAKKGATSAKAKAKAAAADPS